MVHSCVKVWAELGTGAACHPYTDNALFLKMPSGQLIVKNVFFCIDEYGRNTGAVFAVSCNTLVCYVVGRTSSWWRSECDQQVACVQADEAWMHKRAGGDVIFLTSGRWITEPQKWKSLRFSSTKCTRSWKRAPFVFLFFMFFFFCSSSICGFDVHKCNNLVCQ